MTLSPLQHQKAYMDEGFEKVFEHIDAVEINLGKRFDVLENRFDKLENKVDSIEGKIDSLSAQVTMITKVVNKIADKI